MPGGTSCSIGGRCCSGTSRRRSPTCARTVDSATENRSGKPLGKRRVVVEPRRPWLEMRIDVDDHGCPLRLSARPLYSRTVLFQMEEVPWIVNSYNTCTT